MSIIDIELFKLNDNLKHNETDYKGLALEFEKSVGNFIYKNGINEEYGARPLKRCIENDVATPLARKILKEDLNIEAVIKVSFKRGKVIFNVDKRVEEVPFYLTEGGAQAQATESE